MQFCGLPSVQLWGDGYSTSGAHDEHRDRCIHSLLRSPILLRASMDRSILPPRRYWNARSMNLWMSKIVEQVETEKEKWRIMKLARERINEYEKSPAGNPHVQALY